MAGDDGDDRQPPSQAELRYDAASNVTSFRTRRGETLGYTYDDLGRLKVKAVPERTGLSTAHTRDIYYGYDLLGALRNARFGSLSGEGIAYYYDGLGRLSSVRYSMGAGAVRYTSYGYDAAGRTTMVQHPDATRFYYAYDNLGRVTSVAEPYQSGSNNHLIARYYYNNAGRLQSKVRGAGNGGFGTSFYYDGIGRLSSMHHSLPGAGDLSLAMSYNPAHQIATQSRSNDLYSFTGHVHGAVGYDPDGPNRYTSVAGKAFTYDANGNMRIDPGPATGATSAATFTYDAENRLLGGSGGGLYAVLEYDPLDRLARRTGGGSSTRFLYDGDALVAEYDGAGNRAANVPGPD